jgi:hypothetical protein
MRFDNFEYFYEKKMHNFMLIEDDNKQWHSYATLFLSSFIYYDYKRKQKL